MKKSYIKVMSLLLICIMMVATFTGCKDKNNGEDTVFLDNTKASETKVLKVGDEIVYLDEINLYALQYAYAFGIDGSTISQNYSQTQTYDEYFKEQVLSQVREAKIEYQVSQKEGITLTKEELDSIDLGVTNFMNSMDSTMLSYFGITKELVAKCFTEQMYNKALEATVQYEGEIEEYQITTIYYLTFLTVSMDEEGKLVTDSDGNPVELDDAAKEEAEKNAKEALEKINSGIAIEDVAAEYNLEYTAGEQSDVYGGFTKEMNEEIDKLEEGKVSPVFSSSYGYNIIKLIDLDNEEAAKSYEEYYKSTKQTEALAAEQQVWFSSVNIDLVNDLYDDVWERFSFVPIGTWFDQLGINKEAN